MNQSRRSADIIRTVTCADGFEVFVYAFEAKEPRAQMVLLAPANGVPGRFYFAFARWLADHGYHCVTWDWRGLGQSAPDSMRCFDANMLDWAFKDQPAILEWAHRQFQKPMIAIGHSFGGQVFGLAGCPARFAKIILFGASNAYWRLWPVPDRYAFRAAISVMRGITGLAGYLPGRLLGLGADLPGGVARQWLTWCLEPEYHQSWSGHAQIEAPVISFAFADDRFAPLEARRDLLNRYGGPKSLVTAEPKHYGVRRVGHLDFFRSQHATALWPDFLRHLSVA